MIILVTGAAGMLGQDVVAEMARRGHRVLPMTRTELNITDLSQVRQVILSGQPDIVINCAAYTAVDQAEQDRERAMQINGLGVGNLALVCGELEIPLVQISTDYVFSGQKPGAYTVFDQPQPINAYGWSKLAGEKYVLQLLQRFYLVRTSWLFGLYGNNFVETILRLAQERKELTVVDDQHGCPTWTQDLARAVADLIATGRYGVYHVTNQGATTWFGLASAIISQSGFDTVVKPVPTSAYPRPAARPVNSVLDSFPLKETIGYLLPSWQDALARYLQLRKGGTR